MDRSFTTLQAKIKSNLDVVNLVSVIDNLPPSRLDTTVISVFDQSVVSKEQVLSIKKVKKKPKRN